MKVVTIGRQFGSGGREFGRRLAEELGFDYYDKEILTEIARKTSLSEEYVRQVVECKPHALYPITVGNSFSAGYNATFSQAQVVYSAQSDIIKQLATKSNCVIIGRCADYILRDEHPFRIFVYADDDSRVSRCFARADEEQSKLTRRQMTRRIKSIDKSRARYYSFYTGLQWGDKSNYDVMLNTSGQDIKQLVSVFASLIKSL